MRSARERGKGKREKGAARGAATLLAFCFALLGPGAVVAQTNDPTRPPEGLSGTAGPDAGDSGSGVTLQSVMISTSGRAAIINGVMVKQGGKYGDAVLVKVTENEVVLRGGAGTQVLKLYPAVDKRVATAGKGAPRAAKEKGK